MKLTRRSAIAALGSLSMPSVWTTRALANQTVTVRTLGGEYEAACEKAYYQPFTEQTGITVLKVPATFGKILAMFKSGQIEIDVLDLGPQAIVNMAKQGLLANIQYDDWKTKSFKDVEPDLVKPGYIAHTMWSQVMAFNKDHFGNKRPENWSDFWDTAKFPGPRMLAGAAYGSPDLEFALLADGVPMDKIYPIDLERAFQSLSKIRKGIRKFYDSGALSTQMLTDKEVVLGTIPNGRVQVAIRQGAPLGFHWNQAYLAVQYLGIAKGAPNEANAQKLVEFMLQAKGQAELATRIPQGPANSAAISLIPQDIARQLNSYPENRSKQFLQNGEWWSENGQAVADRWSKWMLEAK